MGYRYILLINRNPLNAGEAYPAIKTAADRLGLQERFHSPQATLFACAQTPTMQIPDGGFIIGHVFNRHGAPEAATTILSTPPSDTPIRSSIMESFWGEYVLYELDKSTTSQVSITRDPSGGVPCVYSTEQDTVFVTSDISIPTQLNLHKKQIDWNFIAHFLTYPSLKTERTGLEGIRELLPGCTLHVRGAATFVELAWSPWDFIAPPRRQSRIDDAAMTLRATAERTIRSWAKVDRSMLLELSGGLDSSIVGACLKGTDAAIACATLVPDLPGADERSYASIVASELGVDLHVEPLHVDRASFDAAPPPWWVIPGHGPLQHAANHVMEMLADRKGLRVFYSGGGGDSVFSYLAGAAPAADAFKERGLSAGLRAVRDLSEMHQCTVWRAARLTLRKLTDPSVRDYPASSDLLCPDAIVDAPDSHPWLSAPANALPGDLERVRSLVGTQMFKDGVARGMSYWLRLPLLSQPVMEICLSIPTWMSITNGRNRSVARQAFSDALPPCIIDRRSKGTFAQYNGAVYRKHKERMCAFLLEGELHARGLLDGKEIERYTRRPPVPRDRSFMRIFDLCRTENWVRNQH